MATTLIEIAAKVYTVGMAVFGLWLLVINIRMTTKRK